MKIHPAEPLRRVGWRVAHGPLSLALALAVALAQACAPAGVASWADADVVVPCTAVDPLATRAAPVFPGAEWERIDRPESVGWSSEGLRRVEARLQALPTTAFMAIVGGRVLFEYGDVEAVSYLASVRKSVLSMLYGIYVEKGVIDLDATLAELGIDDVGGLTDQEKQATVRHLLSARSGIYHPAANGGDDLASAPPRGSKKPGEYFLYNNWDFNALGTIFEQETGRSIYDALETDLARPLGFRDFDRARHRRTGNAERSIHLAYHMHLSTRDMARIGYLMLREGNWNGRQIVPRDWVHESTRPITRRTEMNPERRREGPFGYGYLWWVFDDPSLGPAYEGAFTGLGAYGQHILVMPALDLVVAHKTRPGRGRRVTHEEFLEVVALLVQARCGGAAGGANPAGSPPSTGVAAAAAAAPALSAPEPTATDANAAASAARTTRRGAAPRASRAPYARRRAAADLVAAR
ncbi:MAG TPA: serine hydrolase [Longimicrobiales bacterium]